MADPKQLLRDHRHPAKCEEKDVLALGTRITAGLPAHWLAQALPLLHILNKINAQCKMGREEAEESENKQASFIVQLKPHAQARAGKRERRMQGAQR